MTSKTNTIFSLVRFTPNSSEYLDRKLGSRGELFYDRDADTLRIYNGRNQGGIALARADLSNISETAFVSLANSSGMFGPNIHIHNTTVNANSQSGDKDYVTFTVGTNDITALYLTKYVGSDSIAFFGIQEGDAWTAGVDTTQMLTYGHFGPGTTGYEVGDNILEPDDVVLSANTSYTMWIQQTGSNITEYIFSTNPYYTSNTLPPDYSGDPANPTVLYQDGAGGGGASISVSATLPENPESGNLWLNTNNGALYVYIDDGDTQLWMQPSYPQPNIGNISFNTTTIDSIDSSAITFQPAVIFNSDITVENDLRVSGDMFVGSRLVATTNYVDDQISNVVVGALNITPTSIGLGNVTNESKATMFTSPTFTGTINLSGTTIIQQTTEVLNTKTGATGTVTHDFSTGAVWYHSSMAADFTANFTNVPTTDNRAISVVLVLNQGVSGYYANAVQIDGASQTIKWLANSTPTASTSKIDILSFTLIRTGSAWTVLGSMSSYGA